ncbi:MAG: hypothetical protein JWP08_4011, partial [Bryobacterales bacterium]|nr:hypothetical protein [Bryobacterales bacterium]
LQHTTLSVYTSFEDQRKALSLYLRYKSTNDRAFSKCLNDLLKLRAEKRKPEIGFEREKQREAKLARKHEAHETKVHSANARAAAEQKPDNDIRGVVETQLPGHAAVQFSPKKGVLSTAIDNFAAELDAAPELAKILKAA